MNYQATLFRIRDLARSKMLELQPFSGEEMNLPETDLRRAGFVDGERALAAQILTLIDEAQHGRRLEDAILLGR